MTSPTDTAKLKAMAMAMEVWRKGGMDTLVKVAPRGLIPGGAHNIGYCTTFKFVVGRTPAQMEQAVGLRVGSKLATGADIFLVRPLPSAGQFELRGYSQTPGIPTNIQPAHPGYPPGLGVPQWELTNYPQSHLTLLASVAPGQQWSYPVASLPPPM